MIKDQSLVKKSIDWLKSDNNYLVIISALGVLYLAYSSYSVLYSRIEEAGWHRFPHTWADWFAIAGSLIVLPLIVLGTIGIVKFVRSDSEAEHYSD